MWGMSRSCCFSLSLRCKKKVTRQLQLQPLQHQSPPKAANPKGLRGPHRSAMWSLYRSAAARLLRLHPSEPQWMARPPCSPRRGPPGPPRPEGIRLGGPLLGGPPLGGPPNPYFAPGRGRTSRGAPRCPGPP